MTTTEELFNMFANFRRGSQIVSIKNYKSADNEISDFQICFHMSYRNALQKSLNLVSEYVPKSPIEEIAKKEIVESYTNSLNKFNGENDREEAVEDPTYEHVKDDNGNYIKGIKVHRETGDLYMYGLLLNKKVVVPVERKPVKSRELTIAKNKIKKSLRLPVDRFRQYVLTKQNFEKITIENCVIDSLLDVTSNID